MNKEKGYAEIIVMLIVTIIIIGIFGWIIHSDNENLKKIMLERANKNTYKYELIQISNTKDINGHMSTGIFCGYGYINEKPYYYMYVKKNDGIQLLKLEAEDNITIYQDTELPYIKSHSEFIDTHDFFVPGYTEEIIEIHIPPDSMVQNIDINSENFK